MKAMRTLARLGAIVAAALLGAVLIASPASANPGPGNSNQCAPGQHSGPSGTPVDNCNNNH